MSEAARIVDQLRRAYEGEAWHGPSLTELLKGVTSAQAAARPIPGAHSVWEIVLHVTAWEKAVRRRIEGDPVDVPDEGDWPSVSDTSDPAWKQALEALGAADLALREIISALSDEQLQGKVAGRNHTVYFSAHGIVQHNLDHAGQIALLKKTH